jgi:NAD+ kinase
MISKVTLFEMSDLERRDPNLVRLLRDRDPLVARIESSHLETLYARERVRKLLIESGVRVVDARRLGRIPNGRYDLIVCVGGDGTVLNVARHVDSTPILAVNSSPSTSVGWFTCATADSLPDMLAHILEGATDPVSLARIRMTIDGKSYSQPVLNDVLVANSVPSATSRYILRANGREEEQKSSGVWVATAAGSTGAIRSAGGRVQDIRDRRLQYLVREPFHGSPSGRLQLLKGMVGDEGVGFVSRMIHGMVFLDGRQQGLPIGFGSSVSLTPDGPPLRLFLGTGRGRAGATKASMKRGR